jgi:hypothetical protein
MIKTVIAKGDVEYLFKLYEIYTASGDEKELLKICGKIIQKSFSLKENQAIGIFDTVYNIISKQRAAFRNIIDLEITNKKSGIKFILIKQNK